MFDFWQSAMQSIVALIKDATYFIFNKKAMYELL